MCDKIIKTHKNNLTSYKDMSMEFRHFVQLFFPLKKHSEKYPILQFLTQKLHSKKDKNSIQSAPVFDNPHLLKEMKVFDGWCKKRTIPLNPRNNPFKFSNLCLKPFAIFGLFAKS